MQELLTPLVTKDLQDMILEANDKKNSLEIMGHGTKRSIGRLIEDATPVTMRRLSEITYYEPSELIISARAGTPIAEIEREIKGYNQQIPFEYLDFSEVFGTEPGWGTVGSMFATNLSGSRRILKGSARDHMLGVKAVNGRGEIFISGGRVMKNVTGYDLTKLMANSWGTLAVMTEITMKLLPQPESECSLFIYGLSDDIALEALRIAVDTPYEVSGAVHLNRDHAYHCLEGVTYVRDKSVTAIRIENTQKSVSYRSEKIKDLLSAFGDIYYIDGAESRVFWDAMRQLKFLSDPNYSIWRISTMAANAHQATRRIGKVVDGSVSFDWAGGLIWMAVRGVGDMASTDIRRIIAEVGGHATLIRTSSDATMEVGSFQPLNPTMMKLTKGLKHCFDPNRVLNPSRMYEGV